MLKNSKQAGGLGPGLAGVSDRGAWVPSATSLPSQAIYTVDSECRSDAPRGREARDRHGYGGRSYRESLRVARSSWAVRTFGSLRLPDADYPTV